MRELLAMAARAPSEEVRPESSHYWARHTAELRARLARELADLEREG